MIIFDDLRGYKYRNFQNEGKLEKISNLNKIKIKRVMFIEKE